MPDKVIIVGYGLNGNQGVMTGPPTVYVATNGEVFSGDGPSTVGRNVDGSVAYIQYATPGGTYRDTWTNDGSGNLIATSGWVRQ